jgi:hypothetical protein
MLIAVMLAAAVSAGLAVAQPPATQPASPETATFVDGGTPVDATPGRLYGSAEYLVWWMRGANLPPLVTTSPAGTPIGQAGQLNSPGTFTVFGASTVNDEGRSGMRFTVGGWIDRGDTWGVEGSFFLLETKAARFDASSNGSPILGRPFVNANTGFQDAERIAFPGDVTGSVDASDSTDGLVGAGLLVRRVLANDGSLRFDGIVGYRYLRFSDHLGVTENLTSVNPNNPSFVAPGTQIRVADSFGTKNEFNGIDLGLDTRFNSGPLGLQLLAKIAVGESHETVDINGNTTVTVPGLPPSSSTGGLLALQSNIGHHSREECPVIPELDVNANYQITSRLRLSVGYSLLYWANILRAGDQVDLTVNPNLLPNSGTAAAGPQRPAFTFQPTHLLAQGVNLGLEFQF